MHRSEQLEYATCAECGAETAITERAFAFGEDGALCFGCAVKRHGSYDEVHDRWQVAPEVSDLLEPAVRT